jgi:hypothetical protein
VSHFIIATHSLQATHQQAAEAHFNELWVEAALWPDIITKF